MNSQKPISLLDLLESQKLTKQFYHDSKKMYKELIEKYNFNNLLTFDNLSNILTDVLGKENSLLLLKDQSKDSLFEDDVFCFAMQVKLVDIYGEQEILKGFLSKHRMYSEAMKEKLYKDYIESI